MPHPADEHLLSVVVVLLLALAGAAQASEIIAAIDTSNIRNNYSGSLGYAFTVRDDAPITVMALGFYDYQDNGLATSHDIGIYDYVTSDLVVSVTVPSGTSGYLQNHFRWVTLPTPASLTTGTIYQLVGVGIDGDLDYWINVGGTPNLGLNTALVKGNWGAWFSAGTTLAYPIDQAGSQDGFGTVNLSTTIPEPASALFLILGAGAFWLRRRLQP